MFRFAYFWSVLRRFFVGGLEVFTVFVYGVTVECKVGNGDLTHWL